MIYIKICSARLDYIYAKILERLNKRVRELKDYEIFLLIKNIQKMLSFFFNTKSRSRSLSLSAYCPPLWIFTPTSLLRLTKAPLRRPRAVLRFPFPDSPSFLSFGHLHKIIINARASSSLG